jgi:NAD(P)-dependent dehydrogenase (short-subunit alcohol dehydrogenase family)
MNTLSGRTVVVTGGSMGIGYACAEAALAAGANVVIAARGEHALIAAADTLGGSRVLARACDVTDAAQVDALFADAIDHFGVVDGVVHAAAVLGPIGEVTEIDENEWFDAVRVDLFGTFLVARTAARALKRRGGKIVLLSGGGATSPFPRYSAYAASKAAVVRLAETLAEELAPYHIDVNALAPGFVATRMHAATLAAGTRAGEAYLRRTQDELERGGVPASLAASAAVFLLSAASDGITGRLLAAPWDAWTEWPERVQEIRDSDVFTLRRIVPRDRGMEWQ